MDRGPQAEAFAQLLREHLLATIQAHPKLARRISLESVDEDRTAAVPAAVIELADTERAGCRFARRCSADIVGNVVITQSVLDIAASICAANIEEHILAVGAGLPQCSPGETVWF